MIDFNKVEEYVKKYKDEKNINLIPRQNLIPREEIIPIEELIQVADIFKKYNFDKWNIFNLIEEASNVKKRKKQTIRRPKVLLQFTCDACGEKILIKWDFYHNYCSLREQTLLLHFFRNRHFWSYRFDGINNLIPIVKDIYKKEIYNNDIYLCKDCFNKYDSRFKETLKDDKERRKAKYEENRLIECHRNEVRLTDNEHDKLKDLKYEAWCEQIRRQENEILLQQQKIKEKKKHDKMINEEVEKYMEKYKTKSFDFYDALSLFFKTTNNEDDAEIIKKVSQKCDIIDFMTVAFDEPQKQDKEKYMIDNYSYQHYSTEFLLTLYWKTLADLRKEKDHHICQICGGKEHLDVHHKGYKEIHGKEHLRENFENKLITVCTRCHQRIHDGLKIQ